MTQYTILATLELRSNVTVEAETSEEALEKFARGEFVDDGRDVAERFNWTAQSSPKPAG